MSPASTRSWLVRSAGVAGRLAALLGTSYFLIATSQIPEPEQLCRHAAESVTFEVSGTCGPRGTITVTSATDECTIAVRGAGAVGLPSGGRFFDNRERESRGVSILTTPWSLSGYLTERPDGGVRPDSGAEVGPVDAGGDTGVTDAGAGDAGAGDGGAGDGGADTMGRVIDPSALAQQIGRPRRCTVRIGRDGPDQITGPDEGSTATACIADLDR